jgi:probable HAF family extracellular repeat protein
MTDLGTLGGTIGVPSDLNNRGQVVGNSNLAGDLVHHPFLWTKAGGMQDLGTFGGSNGNAVWINDDGDVVGEADFPGDQVHDGFLWRNGVMTDLGNLGQTSFALSVNSKRQVVGHSLLNDGTFRATLSEDGGPMIDLNTLIPPGSSLQLEDAQDINERGEIAGIGRAPATCQDVHVCGHAYLLIPCDEHHPGQCEDYSMVEVANAQNIASAPKYPSAIQTTESPAETVRSLRNLLRQRNHVPGQPTATRD